MEKTPEIINEINRSEKALSAAKILMDAGLYEDSLSRCYYSVLHASKAALLSKNIHVESHDAVKRLFGKELVKPGYLEDDYAIIMREEQDDRLLADYDVTFLPEKNLLIERISDAERFYNRILLFLDQM